MSVSVYSLIKGLCVELINEGDYKECDVASAKRVAFEVLLKKSQKDEKLCSEKLIENYQFCSFELKILNKADDARLLDKYIEQIKENEEVLLPISTLLINLKNIESDAKCKRKQNDNFFLLPSSTQESSKKNVYMPKVSLIQQQLPFQLTRRVNKTECSIKFFSNILSSHVGNDKNKNWMEDLKLKQIEAPKNIDTDEKEKTLQLLKSVNTWENLDNKADVKDKTFSSESNESHIYHHLLTLSRSKVSTEITSIPFAKLINDIKLLMIGIESESFKRAEDTLRFYPTIELVCDGISNLSHYAEGFIEMGTCFKRLKTYTSKNPFNQSHIFDGFLFKAFSDRIVKFLNHCRDIIYSQEIETFLELNESTVKLRKIVIHLARFLNIHPSSAGNQIAIPTGSDFLRLLYEEYTKVLDNDLKCFYIELLKSCCEVYYLRYQDWFYHGQLEDPHKELFIYFVDHYNENTKHYFDKAYLIRKQSVPAFLHGCTDNVLLCGKYTMLLKSFKPLHPLFRLRKPSYKICLTFNDLANLKAQCNEFSKRAREECGEVISIESILNERKKIRMEKSKNAEKATARNIIKWKEFQEERQLKLCKFREIQQKELCKELQTLEERRLVKRLAAIEAEREYLDECEEIERVELEKENREIRERIKIYQKLNEELDESNDARDKILESIQSKLKSDDILNANEETNKIKEEDDEEIVKDDMNNVIETLNEAQRNKLKVMSHEYNFSSTSTSSVFDKHDKTNANVEMPTHTEAQRNKLKVMSHEFGMIEIAQPKIAVQDYDKMTDLQKNRMKVLSYEFGTLDVKEEQVQKEIPQGPMTDLQRNRIKVLSHEFAYFDVEEKQKKKRLSLDWLQTPEAVATKQQLESPMSVTSDHFVSDTNEQQQQNEEISRSVETIGEDDDDDEGEEAEMMRAFEEAVEKNRKMFMGITLNDFVASDDKRDDISFNSKYEDPEIMDTMALSQFLQMSLTIPLNAYMEVLNNETLKMFITDLDILSHFKSLRNYFLLMNGEFCSSICHQMFSKLERGVRPVELLNYQSLHTMLDNALQSGSRIDANTENLSFIVQTSPEKFELHSPAVLNMLTLSYKLEWPLTLILNTETMDQYQRIFNYLLKLKRISWILEECFQILKETYKQHGKELLKSPQYRNVQQTRHQMTQFVNCLENYVTRNVMQTAWNAFMQDLKSARSILCIYRKHTNYLKRILFLCLLNKKSFEFYKTIEDVFKVILRFHKHLKSKSWQSLTTTSSTIYSHAKYQKIQNDAADFDRLIRYVMYLGNKIIQHNYQKEINDLLSMIDINGYYSNR